ncbi:hypothetical protein [Subdoligranulum variabile]|uniref:Uncharacterized protein n=1 Tax=Subdoligranulum variabile DSM 15176 TaxID=411471 RepID=D1PPD6_9FIRM|nr:hypothetical protein [Subdoligranulum variabile]EFB75398.1 hypothetical protein SUBVAR_06251 [Subdoligranulum variabile DSM 15176]UWP69070.1 hypothetical protein NQ490_04245 [Subdoligranulum variabile]
MKNSPPLQMTVQFPQTRGGKEELAQRIAELHADCVRAALNQLNCPVKQKRELLQAIIDTYRSLPDPRP